MANDARNRRFELLAMPHLDAAFNLARWLTGNTADAEDVVQEAFLRAFRYRYVPRRKIPDLAVDHRAKQFSRLAERQPLGLSTLSTCAGRSGMDRSEPKSGRMLLDRVDSETLATLVAQLPTEYREILILREIEDLSYKDIAAVTGIPLGTVMSRLSRARLALRKAWINNEMRP